MSLRRVRWHFGGKLNSTYGGHETAGTPPIAGILYFSPGIPALVSFLMRGYRDARDRQGPQMAHLGGRGSAAGWLSHPGFRSPAVLESLSVRSTFKGGIP